MSGERISAASAELQPPPRTTVELTEGRSIALAQAGHGTDCLLIHGTLMTLDDMWIGLAPTLAREFRVTAVDRPGHGFSQRRRFLDASPWRQAALIHDAGLRAGLHRPIVVGHSYGATVALAYAQLYPDDAAGVVALAPMCFPELRLETVLFGPRGMPAVGDALAQAAAIGIDPALLPMLWQAMYLPQVMPRAFAESFPFALAAGPGSMIVEGEDAIALPSALMAMAAGFASCKTKIRIIGGSADAVVNNAAQGCLAATLIPGGHFTWIPGCGHMLQHFAQGAVMEACAKIVE